MLLFRSLSLGLLGACVILLAELQMRPASHVHVVNQLSVPATSAPTSPTVINIATRGCALGDNAVQTCFATDLLPLLRLAPDERLLDVAIASPHGERRVVVRMH